MNEDFWNNVTPDVKETVSAEFKPIPNNTYAHAIIEDVKTKQVPNDSEEYFQITWKLLDGEFANRKIWQNLYIFNMKPEKALKDKCMLAKLYEKCKVQRPTWAPSISDLLHLKNKPIGIKIREYIIENKTTKEIERHGNLIADVFAREDSTFHVITGIALDLSKREKTASQPQTSSQPEFNDDIPF